MSKIVLQVLIVCLSLCLNSCKWFESKEAITDRIVKQDMQTIDWNQIDRYPLFFNCDESASKRSQERCFTLELQQRFARIITTLKDAHARQLMDLNAVVLQITNEGDFELLKVVYGSEMTRVKLDSMIKLHLEAIPPINPALKRGIPVSVTYRLPVKVALKK